MKSCALEEDMTFFIYYLEGGIICQEKILKI